MPRTRGDTALFVGLAAPAARKELPVQYGVARYFSTVVNRFSTHVVKSVSCSIETVRNLELA
jgi:hypothetical protein